MLALASTRLAPAALSRVMARSTSPVAVALRLLSVSSPARSARPKTPLQSTSCPSGRLHVRANPRGCPQIYRARMTSCLTRPRTPSSPPTSPSRQTCTHPSICRPPARQALCTSPRPRRRGARPCRRAQRSSTCCLAHGSHLSSTRLTLTRRLSGVRRAALQRNEGAVSLSRDTPADDPLLSPSSARLRRWRPSHQQVVQLSLAHPQADGDPRPVSRDALAGAEPQDCAKVAR